MKEKKSSKESPLLAQYYEIKAQYPDAILLYRVGDFYETFGEDAIKTSKALGIVLTKKAAGGNTFTELAGVPFHALENYLPKLVQAGYKVAVCDQLEDPKLTKKLVRRGVTELVTPGVATMIHFCVPPRTTIWHPSSSMETPPELPFSTSRPEPSRFLKVRWTI